MNDMEEKSFEEMMEKFRNVTFRETFDMIVAIAYGGIIPATIIKQRLNVDLFFLRINLRDQNQKPKYDKPKLLAPVNFCCKGKSVLLVDDRVRTGASQRFALSLLKDAKLVKTFAVNGKADYSLYDEECFKFFWHI